MNTHTFRFAAFTRILDSDRWICAMLLVLVALLYAPSLNIWANGDDFGDLVRAPESPLWDVFSPVGDETSWQFRPLERLVNSINVSLLGYESTLFSHIVALLGFMISVVMVFWLARLLEPDSRGYAILASAYFAAFPTNVFNVIQIDTISQQYATAFSLLVLWWLLSQYHRKSVVYHGVSFLLLSLCLCSKTTSVGFVSAAPLAAYLLGWSNFTHRRRMGLRNLVVSYAGTVILLLVYVLLRWMNGIAFSEPSGVYSPHFSPITVSSNVLILLSGIVYAGSSLDIFPGLQVARVVPSAIFTLGLLGLSGIGIWHMMKVRGHKKTSQDAPRSEIGFKSRQLTVVGLSVLILAGMFPIILIGKMSESYTYGSSPFYALLLGLFVVHGLQAIRSSRLLRASASRVVLVFLLVVIVWLAYGTGEKVRLALDVSDRVKSYFHEMEFWLDSIPSTEVTLCWRNDHSPEETGAYRGFLIQEAAAARDRLFPDEREAGGYSSFLIPDRVILGGVVRFASRLGSKPVSYVAESSNAELCDYEAFVDGDGLHIVRR